MLDLKKENINDKNSAETIEEDVAIHTMQEDLDALSGIFPKNKKTPVYHAENDNIGKAEKILEKPPKDQYFNPFLDKQTFEEQKQEQDRTASSTAKKAVSVDDFSSQQELQEPEESGGSSKKAIWIAVSLIIIGSFTLGGYYFFNKKTAVENGSQPLETQKSEETEAQKNDLVKAEPSPKYSFDNPNYLSIDTENPSYENFKEIISKAFSDIKDSGINKPVEFVITDSKNDPVAFPIFSAIAKLKLSNELLKNLNDEFSVFAYYDSENPRLALSIKVTDELKAKALIKNEEIKLPAELASLFLENISLPKGKVVFEEGSYRAISIRYFNLMTDQLSAVDYSFNGGYLIIGTSKNSMWAILDKILNEKQQE